MILKTPNTINFSTLFSTLFSTKIHLSKEIFCDKKSTSYVRAEHRFQLKLMVSILMMLLTQLSFSQSIYFEDGICKCPSANVGDTQTIGGIIYTVVDNSNLSTQLSNNNYNLCTTKVTIMRNNISTNGDISFWDVSNVTDMRSLFKHSNSFNQDISGWDVSSVTNMESMFADTGAFNQDISGWDVSSVTNMKFMFKNASAFNQDIGGWCVTNISSEPEYFSTDSRLEENNKPNWGTCPALGIDDQNLITISIYPNPTDNTLFISGNESPIVVSIYNVLGKEVFSAKNANNINVQAFPSGVYVIRISDGIRQTNRKFVKN